MAPASILGSDRSAHTCRLVRDIPVAAPMYKQGLYRLKKYLNLEGFLEKSLKIKSALKSTGKSLKGIERSLNSSVFCRTVDRDLYQYKIVVPLFDAANAAPNKGTTISYSFSNANFSIISV